MTAMRSRRFLPFLIPAVAVAGLLASPASAGQPRTHDGLLLRLSGGFGTATSSIDDVPFFDNESLELSGVDGDFNFAIGGTVASNFIIHGTFWGWGIADPEVEVGEVEGDLDGDLTLSGVGGGVTYYFMPANIYLSGSVGPAWLSLTVDGDESSSDTGFALDITLGKEWWVGGSWGLGLAGCFGYHTVPDEDIDQNWSGTSLGLRFSATLN